jgi:fucose 4-O-acetylase-like acetyltransferase
MINVSEVLEPIASWFASLGVPEPIVRWGHPAMMGIVIFVMGSFVGITGWRGRLVEDKDAAIKSRGDHRQMAPLMFLFIVMGATGGVLSLVMQHEPVMESPHFWTGISAIALLGTNAIIALTKFGGNKAGFRAVHAYVGSAALCLLFLHALLGLKLGISLS